MITKTGVRIETATTVTWTFRNDYDSDSEYDCYDELGGSRPPRPAGGGGSRPPPPGRFRTPEPGGVAAHSREEGRLPRGVGCPQTSWAAAAGRRRPPAGGRWPPPADDSDDDSDKALHDFQDNDSDDESDSDWTQPSKAELAAEAWLLLLHPRLQADAKGDGRWDERRISRRT